MPCDEIPYSRIFCISIGSLEFSGKKPGFLPSGALRDRLFNSRCDLFWHPLLSQAWDRIYIRAWLPCILFLWIHLHMIRNKEFCQHSTKGAMVTHVADDGMLFKMPTCLDYEIVSSNLACSNFFSSWSLWYYVIAVENYFAVWELFLSRFTTRSFWDSLETLRRLKRSSSS